MEDRRRLIEELSRLGTEQVNERTLDIDRLSAEEIVRRINDEDKTVALVVERALPQIARAAELFAATMRSGGRVFYIGAGTSGRLGVLDAAECPPTYGTDPSRIVGVIAGGFETLVLSQEGVEDRREAAAEDLRAARPTQAAAEAAVPPETVAPDPEFAALMDKLRASTEDHPDLAEGFSLLDRESGA